jgi:hypothetical protein
VMIHKASPLLKLHHLKQMRRTTLSGC